MNRFCTRTKGLTKEQNKQYAKDLKEFQKKMDVWSNEEYMEFRDKFIRKLFQANNSLNFYLPQGHIHLESKTTYYTMIFAMGLISHLHEGEFHPYTINSIIMNLRV